MEFLPYVILLLLLAGDLFAASILNKQRRALDMSKPESAEKEKKLRLTILFVHVQAIAMAMFVLMFLKPILAG